MGIVIYDSEFETKEFETNLKDKIEPFTTYPNNGKRGVLRRARETNGSLVDTDFGSWQWIGRFYARDVKSRRDDFNVLDN